MDDKTVVDFFGLLFLVCLWLGRGQGKKESLEGDKILVEDVEILMEALETAIDVDMGENAEPPI